MIEKVLIIIPTYNRPWICLRAIESVLKQTYAHWNIIIAKNGDLRSEAYMGMWSRIRDSRIMMAWYPGTGLGYVLNMACRGFLSGYDLFMVLDDDDELDATYLEEMVALQKVSGADVVHCMQRQVPRSLQSDGDHMNVVNIQQRNWINFPECVFVTSLFEDHEFCEECGPSVDWDWHLQNVMVANAQYVFLPKVLVTHHWHETNYCQKCDNFDEMKSRIDTGYYQKLRRERKCQE